MNWQTFRVCLKIGLAVGLAYLLTYGERSHNSLYAVLTAALIVGENFGDDLNQSLVRLVGTLLGAALGVLFLITLGVDVWGVVAAAVAAAVISRLIKLEQLSRVTLAVCMVTLLIRPDHVVSYGMYRFLNTLIGAGIGLGVSILVWPVRAEVAATQAVSKLLLLAAEVLHTVGKPPPEGEEETDQTEMQLGKVFKAIRDARREGQVFRTSATATAERAILGGQVGLGAIAVASGCERLRQNTSAAPFVSAVTAASGRLADRVLTLAKQTDSSQPIHEPFPEMPTPPADADLNATEGVLMAGVIGELRVIASALAVLERVNVQPTKHEVIDQMREDAKKAGDAK
ncbi:FUSC family protein [Limnoglobus roseus]|uniref:FUSC family protein n=1 Tax=Limnoglobus roseus TaxID=2598579 RepID=A0A5C1A7R1_9BACT|nr:FUSC family protein [Limnoglobus roseus]QEL14770.1 FUSC family protein [Limnoglobus roseus]